MTITLFWIDMAPFYKIMIDELQLTADPTLYNNMVAKNEEELKKQDEKAANAEQNEGETEVNEALLAKADYYAKIGDKVFLVRDTHVCRLILIELVGKCIESL